MWLLFAWFTALGGIPVVLPAGEAVGDWDQALRFADLDVVDVLPAEGGVMIEAGALWRVRVVGGREATVVPPRSPSDRERLAVLCRSLAASLPSPSPRMPVAPRPQAMAPRPTPSPATVAMLVPEVAVVVVAPEEPPAEVVVLEVPSAEVAVPEVVVALLPPEPPRPPVTLLLGGRAGAVQEGLTGPAGMAEGGFELGLSYGVARLQGGFVWSGSRDLGPDGGGSMDHRVGTLGIGLSGRGLVSPSVAVGVSAVQRREQPNDLRQRVTWLPGGWLQAGARVQGRWVVVDLHGVARADREIPLTLGISLTTSACLRLR